MTKLLTIPFLFFLLGCLDYNSRQTFLPPDKKSVNEIVEAVINHDSLLFLNPDSSRQILLSVNLRKLRVIVPDTTTDVPPPIDHNTVSIFNLFNSLVNHQRFFGRSDSTYFLSQNNAMDTFTIDKTLTEKIAVTTLSEQQQKTNSNQFAHYYDMTIPILTVDQKKAYIELTNNCSGCGGATAYYLERSNSKWIVVGWQRLWIN